MMAKAAEPVERERAMGPPVSDGGGPSSTAFVCFLAPDAEESLGARLEPREGDALPAVEAVPVLVFFVPEKRGLDLLPPCRQGAPARFDHLLLLDRVDSGHPSDRGLIEFDRPGGIGGRGERLLDLGGVRDQILLQFALLFFGQGHAGRGV